jgi:Asp-tRNA(Asn)/Glu-tRNA(Gln) amidotransferase A subunit family amidase
VAEDELEPITRMTVEAGRRVSGLEYSAARRSLHRASRATGSFMGGYDLILSPTTCEVAPPVGVLRLDRDPVEFNRAASRASAFTALFNMTGQPAMSVPLWTTPTGFPVGVMFAGRLGDESTLFGLAGQLERARPWAHRRPPEPIGSRPSSA